MGKRKNDENQIKEYYLSENCVLLDDYKNALTPMRYICQCGREGKMSWHDFKRGHRCFECGKDKKRGDKNPAWVKDRERKQDKRTGQETG